MQKHDSGKDRLRSLPGIDRMLEKLKTDPFFAPVPRSVRLGAIRSVIEELRGDILAQAEQFPDSTLTEDAILEKVRQRVSVTMSAKLKHLVNATGVIIHTNLGRSILAEAAMKNLARIGSGYSNLEFDLSEGKRGSRYSHVEEILCEISGAEAAMAVNNNAAAVLLCLETIARGKHIIVSRGELVEIGGSFRIPDVMAKSGGILREVGTTNRTHLKDYESAIDSGTGLLLKVHTSNYSVVGFTASVPLEALVELGEKYQLPVMEDLGSGTFVDFSRYGLQKEPTVQESIRSGADVVTFSGDKLLGGPQAGIIVGSRSVIDRIKQNPLTRALRIDKLTLAALESTLKLYRDEQSALAAIPTLRMMLLPLDALERQAEMLADRLRGLQQKRLTAQRLNSYSRVGGGSLPLLSLPTRCVGVAVQGISVNALDRLLRESDPPLIGRIEDDSYLLDVRTIQPNEYDLIVGIFQRLCDRLQNGEA